MLLLRRLCRHLHLLFFLPLPLVVEYVAVVVESVTMPTFTRNPQIGNRTTQNSTHNLYAYAIQSVSKQPLLLILIGIDDKGMEEVICCLIINHIIVGLFFWLIDWACGENGGLQFRAKISCNYLLTNSNRLVGWFIVYSFHSIHQSGQLRSKSWCCWGTRRQRRRSLPPCPTSSPASSSSSQLVSGTYLNTHSLIDP